MDEVNKIVDFNDTYKNSKILLSDEFNSLTEKEQLIFLKKIVFDLTICIKEIFEIHGVSMEE